MMGLSYIKHRKTSKTVLEIKLKSSLVLIFSLKRRNKVELEEGRGGRGRMEVWQQRDRQRETYTECSPVAVLLIEARQRSARG